MLSEQRLTEIEARAKAATNGDLYSGPIGAYEAVARHDGDMWADLLCSENRAADARLFAHARRDVLELVEEVRRLREQVETAREENARLRAQIEAVREIVRLQPDCLNCGGDENTCNCIAGVVRAALVERVSHPMPPDEPTVTLPLAEVRRLVNELEKTMANEWGFCYLCSMENQHAQGCLIGMLKAACPTAVKAAEEGK